MQATVITAPKPNVVHVLDADERLADALGDDAAAAREHLIARLERVPCGVWRPPTGLRANRGIGLLVLDGLLVRRVHVSGRHRAELLGGGDLLRPWQESEAALVAGDASWRVIAPLQIAVLDRRFAARAGRWPDLVGALVGRALARSRPLADQLALAHVPGVDLRLLALFGQLAERWGVVARDGVVIRMRLSHELLGEIVGARRPTVTTALSALSERGELVRRSEGDWLLPGVRPALT